MWYIYTMESQSAIKKNEIMPFAATWMDLESIMLSEVKSHREKQIPHDRTYMCNLKTKQTQQNKSYRHSEQIGGCKRGGEQVLDKTGEGV